MRRNIRNNKVLRAITIGLATMIAVTSTPLNVLADDDTSGASGGSDPVDGSSSTSSSKSESSSMSAVESSTTSASEAAETLNNSIAGEVSAISSADDTTQDAVTTLAGTTPVAQTSIDIKTPIVINTIIPNAPQSAEAGGTQTADGSAAATNPTVTVVDGVTTTTYTLPAEKKQGIDGITADAAALKGYADAVESDVAAKAGQAKTDVDNIKIELGNMKTADSAAYDAAQDAADASTTMGLEDKRISNEDLISEVSGVNAAISQAITDIQSTGTVDGVNQLVSNVTKQAEKAKDDYDKKKTAAENAEKAYTAANDNLEAAEKAYNEALSRAQSDKEDALKALKIAKDKLKEARDKAKDLRDKAETAKEDAESAAKDAKDWADTALTAASKAKDAAYTYAADTKQLVADTRTVRDYEKDQAEVTKFENYQKAVEKYKGYQEAKNEYEKNETFVNNYVKWEASAEKERDMLKPSVGGDEMIIKFFYEFDDTNNKNTKTITKTDDLSRYTNESGEDCTEMTLYFEGQEDPVYVLLVLDSDTGLYSISEAASRGWNTLTGDDGKALYFDMNKVLEKITSDVNEWDEGSTARKEQYEAAKSFVNDKANKKKYDTAVSRLNDETRKSAYESAKQKINDADRKNRYQTAKANIADAQKIAAYNKAKAGVSDFNGKYETGLSDIDKASDAVAFAKDLYSNAKQEKTGAKANLATVSGQVKEYKQSFDNHTKLYENVRKAASAEYKQLKALRAEVKALEDKIKNIDLTLIKDSEGVKAAKENLTTLKAQYEAAQSALADASEDYNMIEGMLLELGGVANTRIAQIRAAADDDDDSSSGSSSSDSGAGTVITGAAVMGIGASMPTLSFDDAPSGVAGVRSRRGSESRGVAGVRTEDPEEAGTPESVADTQKERSSGKSEESSVVENDLVRVKNNEVPLAETPFEQNDPMGWAWLLAAGAAAGAGVFAFGNHKRKIALRDEENKYRK